MFDYYRRFGQRADLLSGDDHQQRSPPG